MIRRKMAQIVAQRLRDYPAVALTGPRQSGKTTLARSLGKAYFDLEQEPERLRLDLEWETLCKGRGLVILDEAQAHPPVFPRLRGAIDQDRRRAGRFLLLGSVSPALTAHVSESLAGRLSPVELTPFLLDELPGRELDRLWLLGGYPEGGATEPRRFPRWQKDYLGLLAHRDLPNWGLPAQPQLIRRLLQMTAALHGQAWNASQVGKGLALTYHTVNQYLDYLVGAFLVRRLPPYHANVSKRLIKTPKVYWRDTGLLHALMNVASRDDLLAQPWVGFSWEGFVAEQVLGALAHLDQDPLPHFLRTSDQLEIDLVLDFGRRLWAIETKLTASPGPDDMARLNQAADLIKADHRILVSQTSRTVVGERRISCNLPWLIEHLPDLLKG